MKEALACSVGLLGTEAESANGDELPSDATGGEDGSMTALVAFMFKGVAVSGGSKGLSNGESERCMGENTVSEDAVLGLRSMASSGMVSSELLLSRLWFPEPPPFDDRLEERP